MKSRSRFIAGAAALSTLLLSGSPAVAGAIGYTLEGVTFNDGGAASGTFSIDSGSGNVLSYDIMTTPGATLSGFEYNGSSSFSEDNEYGANSFLMEANDGSNYLTLQFASSLTGGGTISLDTGRSSYECNNCYPYRLVTGGDATTSPPVAASAPEPASLVIFGAGLAGLGWVRRRRTI